MIAQAEVKGVSGQVSGLRSQVSGDRCQGVVIILDTPDSLLDKIKELKSDGKEIQEVYTPFYVHGLDETLGLKRTRLGKPLFYTDS